MAAEAITFVYQKNHSGRTTLQVQLRQFRSGLAGCTASNMLSKTNIEFSFPPRFFVGRLHVPSAMYHVDQRQWWSQPVPAVQPDGYKSMEDMFWRITRGRRWPMAIIVTAATTYVLMRHRKSPLEVLISISHYLCSSRSAAELCHVPSSTTAGNYRVLCARNDTTIYELTARYF